MTNKSLVTVKILGGMLLGFAILVIVALAWYIPLDYSAALLIWLQGIMISAILVVPAIGLLHAGSLQEFGKSYNQRTQKILIFCFILISLGALFSRYFFE